MEVHRFVVHDIVQNRTHAEVGVHLFPVDSHDRIVADSEPPADGGWIYKWAERIGATAHATAPNVFPTAPEALAEAQTAIVKHYVARHMRVRLDPATTAPILMVQWGAPEERDELNQAGMLVQYALAARDASRLMPEFRTERITDPEPDTLLRGLERFLLENPDVQLVYLSSHGEVDRICFSQVGQPSVPFADVARRLTNVPLEEGVTLVLGMCRALDPKATWLTELPRAIGAVFGFSETPEASDVAGLVASVLLDDVARFEAYRGAMSSVFGGGVAECKLAEAVALLQPALQAADATIAADPAKFVRGQRGGEVCVVTRCPDGAWATERIAL